MEAINRGLSGFQRMANEVIGGEARFYPEVVPELQRKVIAEALAELAGSSWKYSDEIPTNWRKCVATYLKAWAAYLNPMVLLEVGELLAKAGYRSEARDTFRVVLLFPTYADKFFAGQQDSGLVDNIVSIAKKSFKDLG